MAIQKIMENWEKIFRIAIPECRIGSENPVIQFELVTPTAGPTWPGNDQVWDMKFGGTQKIQKIKDFIPCSSDVYLFHMILYCFLHDVFDFYMIFELLLYDFYIALK